MTKRSLILIGSLLFATCLFAINVIIQVTAPISTAQVGVSYNSSVTASGGIPPYTYAVTLGSLPGGLTLNGNSGAITGVPNQAGTFNFTITATDCSSCGLSVASPAARSRTVSQSAPPALSGAGAFTITVAAAANASGAPISPVALLLAGLGMALVGLYQIRRTRQNA